MLLITRRIYRPVRIARPLDWNYASVREASPLKLGKRLQYIDSMVTATYDHIWDCCCDHGLLGGALLSRQAATTIHFVDVVPELMSQLEHKLARFYPKNSTPTFNSQWQIHCMDVSVLPVHKFNGKHLIIIAGVGSNSTVQHIIEAYSAVNISYPAIT